MSEQSHLLGTHPQFVSYLHMSFIGALPLQSGRLTVTLGSYPTHTLPGPLSPCPGGGSSGSSPSS
eukprot:CAMPEP_0169469444 /NCGR_PEP_ID=MMETSP1042-20121227/23479_1 /TAXON_ID=464988 /ORGANISM="Hemiselmis andersenii, Strain CCMP1180" /LENGTH=64 /DNA_ID=CAMNT_0009582913 /DNA_START=12 /DNA_END=202 /DNA_ORIENTATION=-